MPWSVRCCVQKKDGRWHEVLVDVGDDDSSLRFVLSPAETAASHLLLKVVLQLPGSFSIVLLSPVSSGNVDITMAT